MKRRLHIKFLLLLLLFGGSLRAQDFDLIGNEFLVFAGGGISALSYPVTIGERQNGFGAHFGLGYLIALGEGALGLKLGAEVVMAKSTFTLEGLETVNNVSLLDEDIRFESAVTNFQEVQDAILVQVPLMLQVQTTSALTDFYIALGGKVGIPIVGKYSATAASIRNEGYSVIGGNIDAPLNDHEFAGLGTFASQSREGNLDLGFSFSASVEAGLKITMVAMTLYIGLSLDYGLLNIRSSATDLPFIEPSPPDAFTINSITNSIYSQGGINRPFTDKIIPMSFGLRIRVGF